MYSYEEVRHLHLEISSLCNASCPMCLRNVFGGRVNETMPLTELGLDDVRVIFPAEFLRQLHSMYLCGNYGDPMVARDTLEVLAYFRECQPRIRLGIYTNGSGRSPEWWARLAGLVDYCRFSIDGLEDTNHIYRRGTSWERIMAAVTAFVGAGGNAEWDFIVFRHNEHQVEEARALSRRLGFKNFIVKKTYRFFNLQTGRAREGVAVLDREGNYEYAIAAPEGDGYRNQSLVSLDQAVERRLDYQSYLDDTPISCKVAAERKLYVSAEGLVFPCCWTANIYPWYQPPRSGGVWRLIEQLPEGKDSIDATKRPLREIVDGPFFQKLIAESWSRGSIAAGKLEVCSRVCGEFDLYSAQYAGQVS